MGELLKAEKITKVYRMGERRLTVLKGVDLSVPEGEIVAIAGPSGAGKSTLLHILGLLDQADSGRIILRGRELSRLSSRARSQIRNREVGFVFQFFHLLPEFTAWENVVLPLMLRGGSLRRRDLKGTALVLLEQVGLEGRADHFPSQLSGGEQQRVAICRALVNRPALLLADEPTGNLDTVASGEILDLLLRFNRRDGLTVVVVSHNPQVAQWAPRSINLRDGLVVSGGLESAAV